jgi:hypothetical protein
MNDDLDSVKCILNKLSEDPRIIHLIDPYDKLPQAFHPNNTGIKAIVLGCDPTNLKTKRIFITVFGIEEGDDRFFNPILFNLQRVGLSKEDVYVQNLVRNYCTKETAKNSKWHLFAEYWLPEIKKELDTLFLSSVPVLVTAGKIYDFLLADDSIKKQGYKFCYEQQKTIPALANKLGRPMIPFFRHNKYSLKKNFPEYSGLVSSILK